MTGYVVKRLALMLVTLLAIVTLTFFLMHAVPGGPFVSERMLAPEIQAALNAKYHLDDPIWLQYLNYLGSILRLDLGPSFKYPGVSVNQMIADGIAVTAATGLLAVICVIALGVPLGIVAALNRNGWPDRLVMILATIGVAVPSYVIATILLYTFALRLGWVPTFGLDDWRGYILPVLALSGFWISFVARLARSSLLETLDQDFMTTARAKGLKRGQILIKHGLRNSLIPIVTVLGPVVANLVTGSFVIEQIFALPGIGRQFVLAITNRDYTAIMGVTIFYAAILMVMIFIVDLLYLWLDPRIQYEAGAMSDLPLVPAKNWAPLDRTLGGAEHIAAPSLTYWQDVRQRLWANKLAMLSLGFIILLILAAIFGPVFSRFTYFEQDLKLANIPPFFETYAVTDDTGTTTKFFLNSSNFNLYEVKADGEMGSILRGGKKDLLKKTQLFPIGTTEVKLDYSVKPARLLDGAGTPIASTGWQWNQTHLFGTDQLGRDVLVRQFYGARISLTVAFVATLVNFLIGIVYGGIAGYVGGNTDTVMMRVVEIISTIPLTLYVILIMVVLDSGLLSIVVAIGSVFWVDMARMVRGQILTLKQQDYVAAARTMGASPARILAKHLLPNSVGPILVTATMLIPSAIFIESFMSFIGLGVTPPMASWGTLTSEAVETLRTYPHQLFFPAAAISLTMFAFNFLGDGLRDALDPRLRR